MRRDAAGTTSHPHGLALELALLALALALAPALTLALNLPRRATHRNPAGQAIVAGVGPGQGARSAPAASCPPFQPSTSPLPTVRKFFEGSDGQGPSSRLPVVFVHMHKSGGTVMCHL